jgi:branched-chain amino acid transport system permease protein
LPTTLIRPRTAAIALAAFLLVAFPYLFTWPFFGSFLDEFRTFQATRFAIWMIILMGLNLLTGYSGQITLGHGALVAVGAYVAAICMTQFGMPVVLAVVVAGLVTGAIGFLLGVPALRLTGPYLAIATLAMMIALPQILKLDGIREWTGGVQGIVFDIEDKPRTPGMLEGFVSERQWLYYCCIVPALLMTAIAWSITRSRIGRAFLAVRDTEIGAVHMGINVPLYKMTAFGLSAFYAGIGGGLWVFNEAFMSPDTFEIIMSITMLVVIVLGGVASILGTFFAAIIMTFRNDIVDFLKDTGVLRLPGAVMPGQEQPADTLTGALYGLILVITVITMPRGIAGFLQQINRETPRLVAASVRQRLVSSADRASALTNSAILLARGRRAASADSDDERQDPRR